jgi:hypothetical protein
MLHNLRTMPLPGPVNETARIAAIRELLDRADMAGRGRAWKSQRRTGNPLQILFEEIDAQSRRADRYKPVLQARRSASTRKATLTTFI